MRGQDVFYLALAGVVGVAAWRVFAPAPEKDENSDGQPDSWTDRADPNSSRNVVNAGTFVDSPIFAAPAVTAARWLGFADANDQSYGGIAANVVSWIRGAPSVATWINSTYTLRKHPNGHVFLIEVRADGKAARIRSQLVRGALQRLPTPETVTGWTAWPVTTIRP